jgi:hypothetical protein
MPYRFPLKACPPSVWRVYPPSVWRALFGKFFGSTGFGFTKKSSTIPMEGGAFVKPD